MSNLESDQKYNKRKFSLVIHSETYPNTTPTKSYNISHPKKIEKDGSNDRKGRRPLTGSLMMLKQPSEIPVIKVRSMSCPTATFNTSELSHSFRKYSGDSEVVDSLRDAYNTKYVENLKKDLMDFYNLNHLNKNNLEEEMIEEEENAIEETEEDDEEETADRDKEDDEEEEEMNLRMLSSCISNHSTCLTPPLEESEFEVHGHTTTRNDGHHSSITSENYYTSDDQPLTAKSSMTSIYTTHSVVSAEGKRCNRHHHRRPSCAIKFEEPKVMEWQGVDQSNDVHFDKVDDNNTLFKNNYSLQSYSG